MAHFGQMEDEVSGGFAAPACRQYRNSIDDFRMIDNANFFKDLLAVKPLRQSEQPSLSGV